MPKKHIHEMFESIAELRAAERANATKRYMPGNLDDYRLSHETFFICPFDGETIKDLAHAFTDSNGVMYHNSDCASSMTHITDFYERLD